MPRQFQPPIRRNSIWPKFFANPHAAQNRLHAEMPTAINCRRLYMSATRPMGRPKNV